MSDLVARLHGEASEYEPDRVEADLFLEAAYRIEQLEAELAEAKAKIARVEQTVALLDPGQFDRSLALRDGGYSWGFHKARYGAVADVRRALESATPKPTDNGEDDQC